MSPALSVGTVSTQWVHQRLSKWANVCRGRGEEVGGMWQRRQVRRCGGAAVGACFLVVWVCAYIWMCFHDIL